MSISARKRFISLLRRAVRRDPTTTPSPGAPCSCIEDKIERRLCHAGLDLDPRGNLSLNEVLLFLILDPKRHEKIAGFLSEVETARGRGTDGPPVDSACGDTRKTLVTASGPHFTRLTTQLAADRYGADWHDFEQFGNALACFKDEAKAADRPDAPRRFAQTAAVVDGRLKAVMDAFDRPRLPDPAQAEEDAPREPAARQFGHPPPLGRAAALLQPERGAGLSPRGIDLPGRNGHQGGDAPGTRG